MKSYENLRKQAEAAVKANDLIILNPVGLIGLLDAIKELQAERHHWKANHDAQVQRTRIRIDRPDLPLERVTAYMINVELTKERDDLVARLRSWKTPSFIPVEGHPMLEAADALEALQAENARLWEEREEPHKAIARYVVEIAAVEKERDEYQQAADDMAAAHKVERDEQTLRIAELENTLGAEKSIYDSAVLKNERLQGECDTLRAALVTPAPQQGDSNA